VTLAIQMWMSVNQTHASTVSASTKSMALHASVNQAILAETARRISMNASRAHVRMEENVRMVSMNGLVSASQAGQDSAVKQTSMNVRLIHVPPVCASTRSMDTGVSVNRA
jgi:hypothetical protein